MKVHPYADAFPMMRDDALDALAEDIRANGLRHPIVTWTDPDGVTWLVDGRNRFAACELAGVEPEFVALPANANPQAVIRSENGHRNHLTVGQRAMAEAMYLAGQGLRDNGRWAENAVVTHGVTGTKSWPNWMAQAGVVIDAAVNFPAVFADLPRKVICGDKTFSAAVDEARNARAAAELAELERHKPLTDWLADIYAIDTDLEKLRKNPPRLNAPPTRRHITKFADTAKAIRAHLRAITSFLESEGQADE